MSTTRLRLGDFEASLHVWTGSASELATLARERGLPPGSGSPLLDAAPSGGSHPGGWPGELEQALPAVARPHLVIELFHEPPAGGAFVRFYGRPDSAALACHWRDGGLDHVGWPVPASAVERLALTLVQADRPAEALGKGLVTDRAGFETTIALVDVLRERSLLAMLAGDPEPEPLVGTVDLLASALLPRSRADLRWMSARGRRIAPVPLAPSAAGLEAGLARLAGEGWVRRVQGGWLVLPAGRVTCADLAATAGWFSAVRRERRVGPGGGTLWQSSHYAALRCAERIWTFDFAELTAADFTICFGSADNEVAARCVRQLFAPPRREAGVSPSEPAGPSTPRPVESPPVRRPPPEAPKAPPASSTRAARRSGEWYYARDREAVGPFTRGEIARLAAEREITSATRVWNGSLSGWTSAGEAGLLPAAATAPEPRPAPFCTACGARLAPGKRFCTSCGAAVRA